jgi:hypothetical protein
LLCFLKYSETEYGALKFEPSDWEQHS